MPTSSSRRGVPTLKKHKASGRAYARFNRRWAYFGRHRTPESRAEFKRVKHEWERNGDQLPAAPQQTSAPPATPTADSRYQSTVVELVVAYTVFATEYYRKNGAPTDELRIVKSALKIARTKYGKRRAQRFGPLALKVCREAMIDKGWSRKHLNKQIDRVRRAFKWGVENELVSVRVYRALLSSSVQAAY